MVSLSPPVTNSMHRQIRQAFNVDETCLHRGCIVCCPDGVRRPGSWLGTSGIFYDASGICDTCVQTHVANKFQGCDLLTDAGRFVLQFWCNLCMCQYRFSTNAGDLPFVMRLLHREVNLSREALFKSGCSDTKHLCGSAPPGLEAPSAACTVTFQ